MNPHTHHKPSQSGSIDFKGLVGVVRVVMIIYCYCKKHAKKQQYTYTRIVHYVRVCFTHKRFFAITITPTLTNLYRAWLAAFLNPHTLNHNPHSLDRSTLRNIKTPQQVK
jgi:hypothetical protein